MSAWLNFKLGHVLIFRTSLGRETFLTKIQNCIKVRRKFYYFPLFYAWSKFLDGSGFSHPNFLDSSSFYHPIFFDNCVLTRFFFLFYSTNFEFFSGMLLLRTAKFKRQFLQRSSDIQSLIIGGPFGSLDLQTLIILGPLQKLLLPFIFHSSVPLNTQFLLRPARKESNVSKQNNG